MKKLVNIACSHTEVWPIEKFVPHPRNPNKHPPEQIRLLGKIITAQGWRSPICVSKRSGYVIKGHGRLEAARAAGIESAPVDLQDYQNEAEEWADMIADNRLAELAEMDVSSLKDLLQDVDVGDFDMELTGFTEAALAELINQIKPGEESDAEPQIDKAAELNKTWGVKRGDMYRVGDHRLLCGDSTELDDVNRVMGSDRAACVFTSPPYGVGVDYGETYQDTIENLRASLPKLAAIWSGLVCDGGFAVVNFGDIISASKIVGTDSPCEYPMALEYWPAFRAAKWLLWSRRIWCKPGAGTGSMQCISSNRAATNWEHIWTWKKPGPSMFTSQTTGKYPSQNGWFDSSHDEGLVVGLKDHGAGMPPLPALFSISNHSMSGSIVHEPFCGTGTTMVACENLNRKCRGIEISPDYCAVILQRMTDAFPDIKIERAND